MGLRKCKFIEYNGKDKIEMYGLFHEWGSDYNEFEDGAGNFSIGIIETSDGIIHMVTPSNIQFLSLDNIDIRKFDDFRHLGHKDLGRFI